MKPAQGQSAAAKRRKKRARRKNAKPVTEPQRPQKRAKPDGGAPQKPESARDADGFFRWLIHPCTPDDFFHHHWEQKPLHLHRADNAYFAGVFSLDQVLDVVTKRELVYGNNINVAIYRDGRRETLNPEGVAQPEEINRFWDEGATLQVMQPQQYNRELWRLCAAMEEKFGCLVGANAYLTPKSSQGLAPHYDDVEVFILQLEGRKHWRLHKSPYNLPREYSPDLDTDSLDPPFMTVDLSPGDLLYFPRGTIHYAKSFDDAHSTHMTISTYQRTSWYDFMQRALPIALDGAFLADEEYRKGLPLGFVKYMGNAHKPPPSRGDLQENGDDEDDRSDDGKGKQERKKKDKYADDDANADKKKAFARHFSELLRKLADHIDLHEAASDMTVDFVANRIPPIIPPVRRAQAEPSTAINDDSKGKGKKEDDEEEEGEEEEEEGIVDLGIDTPAPSGDQTLIRLKNPSWIVMVKSSGQQDDQDIDEDEDEDVEGEEAEGDADANANQDEDDDEPPMLVSEQDIVAMRYVKEPEGDLQGDDEERLVLFHCLQNVREHHMDGQYMKEHSNPACLSFSLDYEEAILYLFRKFPEFVPLGSLPGIAEEQARLGMAMGMWSQGLLETSKQ